MLQSQGSRQPDPYRTLQLHPQAPRQLVTEAYWTLVERAKHGGNGTRDVTIEALNDAYQLLADDARRRAYHSENELAPPNSDPIHIAVRKKGVLGSKKELVLARDISHYEALRVDRDADTDIIHHAYAILVQQVGGPRPGDVFMRKLLGDAHHTLSNPQLRAQYDKTMKFALNGHGAQALEAPTQAPEPPKASPPAKGRVAKPPRDEEETHSNGSASSKRPAKKDPSNAPLPPGTEENAPRSVDTAAARLMLAAEAAGFARVVPAAETPARVAVPAPRQTETPVPTAAPAEPPAPAAAVAPRADAPPAAETQAERPTEVAPPPSSPSTAAPDVAPIATAADRPENAPAAATVQAVTPAPPPKRRGLFGRKPKDATPEPAHGRNGHKPHRDQAIVEAEVARLLSLRDESLDASAPADDEGAGADEHGAVAEGAADTVPDQVPTAEMPPSNGTGGGGAQAGGETSAELLVVGGPHTGSRTPLGEHAATIGSSRGADLVLNGTPSFIAPEHVRVWQHGGHFMLRQLDRQGTLINGEPMLLPMVILDDGDEIGIGGYRIRFVRNSPA